MNERTRVGYTVYAKRPDSHSDGYEYNSVGSVRPQAGQCENHQAYCQESAKERGDTEVVYVIAEVTVLSDEAVRDLVAFEEARERDEAKARGEQS